MHNLTHYELTILIKNEIQNMQKNAIEGLKINYIHSRAQDIIKYIEEFNSLEPLE